MARLAVLLAASVAVLAVLVVAALWAFQRHLVYLPDREPVPPAATVLSGALDIVLETDDGLQLGSWYLPAPTAGARPCWSTVAMAGLASCARRWHASSPSVACRCCCSTTGATAATLGAPASRAVNALTTVIYGTADSIVPPEQSRRVAAAAARLHRLVPISGADHNDLVLLAGDDVARAVAELADTSGAG